MILGGRGMAALLSCAAATPMPALAGTIPLAELLKNLSAIKGVRKQFEADLSGCTVLGTLCQDARVYKQPTLGLFTAIQDEHDPSCNIKLLVNNFALSSTTDSEARVWFPRGALLRIVEPRLLVVAGMGFAMMVDNPASMEILGLESYRDRSESQAQDGQALWRAANAAFSRDEFLSAAFLYRECVERGFPGALQALSRSSEAWLRLGIFEKACSDASKALAINPSHSRSLIVKGQALSAMQEYAKAVECLELAETIASDPQEKSKAAEARQRSSALLDQSVSGSYDLSKFLLSGRSPSAAPECSDFVGAVRLGAVPGKGRGLFATKDLVPGDLVLVSNSIARSSKGGGEFHAKIGRACMASRRTLAQLTAYFDETAMFDMDLFRPNSGWLATHDQHSSPTSSYRDVFSELGKRNGLCPLATLINHSCIPNASRHPVGGALFVRAARDVAAGQELITCYVNPFQPLADRRRQLAERNFKFVCRCARCELEEAVEAARPGLATRYSEALQNTKEPAAALEKMVAILREVDAVVGDDARKRQWMLASYPYVYWAAAYLCGGSKAEKEARLESAAAAIHDTAPGDLLALRKMVELCSPGGSEFKGAPVYCSGGMRELLEREAVACFGHQNAEVTDAVIRTPGAAAAGDLSF